MRLARLTILVLTAISLASPATAQFGGLKKKIKKAAGQEDTRGAAAADPTPAQGGSVVLTPDVVDKLILGLKADQAEREAAAKEDTPYGRYQKSVQAYREAGPKCEAGRQAWAAKGNTKEIERANALLEKSMAAQQKQDYKTAQLYQDSLSLLQGGPSCLVKRPEQPDSFYQWQRELDVRGQQAAVKASGLSAGEYAMAQERAMMLLRDGAPSDASESEKKAVMEKKAQLQPLLWPQEKPAVAATPAPQPAPAPTPAAAAQPSPPSKAAASKMNDCMMHNMKTHTKDLERLAKKAQAAQQAGDQATMMAIADSATQIQMAGCMGK
jgi:hypothetical protein